MAEVGERRIHDNEAAYCDRCAEVTNTVCGRCPVCGYVKDLTWVPPPRRRRIIPDGPDDRVVVILVVAVFVALGKLLAGLL